MIIFIMITLFTLVILFNISSEKKPEIAKKPTPPPVIKKDRPNVVLLVIDALRADKLGFYGFDLDISPELDDMARQGVQFETTWSQCSWTRPSIASMITSLYPRSLGIYKEQFDILADKYRTLAEILKEEGYKTIGITANPNINSVFNFHQGFDVYIDTGVIWKWMTPEKNQTTIGEEAHLPQCREVFHEILEQARNCGEQPGFIQIDIMEVHSPYLVRQEYQKLYQDFPVKEVRFKVERDKLEDLVHGTLAAVRQVSKDFADFVQNLQQIPGWQDTLFIITSDHGQGLDDHPEVAISHGHGNLLYESHIRVPLIFYHPGAKTIRFTPHKVAQPVQLLDIMPTILEYLDITLPKNLHGRSLLPLLLHPEAILPPINYFIAETHWREVDKIAIYTDQWKYFENFDHWEGLNKTELQPYGITENGKITDLINNNKQIAEQIRKELYRWMSNFPKAPSMQPSGKVSNKEIQQLKTLGYLN